MRKRCWAALGFLRIDPRALAVASGPCHKTKSRGHCWAAGSAAVECTPLADSPNVNVWAPDSMVSLSCMDVRACM